MLRRLLGEPRRSTLSCVKHTRAAFVNTASSLSLVTLHFKWTFFSVSSLACVRPEAVRSRRRDGLFAPKALSGAQEHHSAIENMCRSRAYCETELPHVYEGCINHVCCDRKEQAKPSKVKKRINVWM